MKNQILLIRLFLFGVAVCSVLAVPFMLDFTNMPRVTFFSAVVLLLLYFLYKSKNEFKLRLDFILGSYFAYTLFSALSIIWAHNTAEALFSAEKQVLSLCAFLFTFYFLKQDKNSFTSALLKISVLVNIIVLAVMCYQMFQLNNFDGEALYAITGVNGHKNLLSSFLFLNLFFLINAYFQSSKSYKTETLFCIALTVASIIFLKTKAVWLGMGITAMVFLVLFLYHKLKKDVLKKVNVSILLPVVIVCINIFFFFGLKPIINKSLGFTQATENKTMKLEQERLVLWDKTYYLIEKNPLIGVGCGNWQIEMPDATLTDLWRAEDLNFTFQRPHNDFLWILSETGIIGFNLYLMFVVGLLLLSIKILKTSGNKQTAFQLMICVSFIVGYLVISFFDFPKERVEHNLWLNMIFAFAYYQVQENYVTQNSKPIPIQKPFYFVAILLAAFMLYTNILRCKGEFFTRKIYDAKHENNAPKIIQSGNSAFNFAYTIDPLSLPIHWYRGNAYAARGNFKEAYKDFQRAYHYNPYNRNVLNDLASACIMNGDTLQAKLYYKEAARISPRYDEAKLNLAAICIAEKNYEEANYWLKLILHNSERRSNYQNIVDEALIQPK
ncbi:MAG: O-antigen ligase family protein [Bacteroidetes bacterium]|nr:O-antigen ligase family protein [Bacteroidota bacterium]